MEAEQIVKREGIKKFNIPLDNAYGVILKGKENYIFINNKIDKKYANFVLLHELGHYFIENVQSAFFCTEKRNMSEIRANTYACLMCGKTRKEWEEKGCPNCVANEVIQYISQNREIYMQFYMLGLCGGGRNA
ncbi:ImmA/IrrE family metallo-endopeptidase [Amedibacillus sp. YH-ame6]